MSVRRVVDALNEEFHMDLDLSNLKKLENLVSYTQKSRQYAIRGAIGALDRSLIWQKTRETLITIPIAIYAPARTHYTSFWKFVNRRFIWFDISSSQSTHDSLE